MYSLPRHESSSSVTVRAASLKDDARGGTRRACTRGQCTRGSRSFGRPTPRDRVGDSTCGNGDSGGRRPHDSVWRARGVPATFAGRAGARVYACCVHAWKRRPARRGLILPPTRARVTRRAGPLTLLERGRGPSRRARGPDTPWTPQGFALRPMDPRALREAPPPPPGATPGPTNRAQALCAMMAAGDTSPHTSRYDLRPVTPTLSGALL